MSEQQHEALRRLLDESGAPHRIIAHPDCRTSVESAAARAAAGAVDAIGAKALVVKPKQGFVVLVLPGMARLDSLKVRALIGKFRFARADEVHAATGGLEIGTIPPFGAPLFPDVARLIVDPGIAHAATVGFNAACLTQSIIMTGGDYLHAAKPHLLSCISEAGRADPIV